MPTNDLPSDWAERIRAKARSLPKPSDSVLAVVRAALSSPSRQERDR